ncbi:phage tail tape measure protein [Bowmanella denitrificans]|uniref:phage tail tape measure protein n=1 Tax=Bowmanella denitrificans TaxID=366582 RepID=UPI000C9A2BA5|nr:phage tail tape measure protein [Bowmanella denitrificans]
MNFAEKVEKLMFVVGLTDKTAGPVGAINTRIERLTRNAEKGFRNVAYGAAGITSAVFMLNQAMAPAIDQQRALNEVASLDVEPKALQKLNRMALATQAQFGMASSGIVKAAYDIQSAIAGLTGYELSDFSYVTSVLAKGTKADVKVIADYLGTLYGVFGDTANKMGRSKWVEQTAGQTALAVQMYKTTGSKMAQAFENLGKTATNMGFSYAEQLAILGNLQSTTQGGESGTLFTGYLTGMGKAEKALGVALTNTAGKALPLDQALSNILKKFGHLGAVKRFDVIKAAFGSDTAAKFIDLQLSRVEKLNAETQKIADVNGMDVAIQMAKKMTDPWQQLVGTTKSVHTAFSQALLPVIQPAVESFVRGGQTLLRWTEMFPNLTRLIGKAGLAVIGLMGTIAAMTVAVGIYRFAAVGLSAAHMLLFGRFGLFTPLLAGVTKGYKAARVALIGYHMAVTAGAAKAGFLTKALVVMRSAVWGFNAALLASPITWIVLGVVALGVAAYALYKHWDQVSTAVTDFLDKSVAFQLARVAIDAMLLPLRLAWEGLKHLAAWTSDWFNTLNMDINTSGLFAIGGRFEWLTDLVGMVNTGLETLAGWLKHVADNGVFNTIASALGLDIKLGGSLEQPKAVNSYNNVVQLPVQRQLAAALATTPARYQPDNLVTLPLRPESTGQVAGQRLDVPKGGVMQQFRSETNNQGMHIDHVTIRTDRLDDPDQLRERFLVAGL